MPLSRFYAALLAVLPGFLPALAGADPIDEQLAAIARTGPQAAGSVVAREARDALAQRGTEILPRLLEAMDTSNIVAANWYRTVYEEIVTRESARSAPSFPLEFLRQYVADPRRQGRARRLALQLVDRLDPDFGRKLLPTLLDDPQFNADAVALAIAAGDAAQAGGHLDRAVASYRAAFEHARDTVQLKRAADKLRALGQDADLVAHLAFVIDWWLLGPFDAPGRSGFARAFAPETKFDLGAKYDGQGDKRIGWTRHQTDDELGLVDLNAAIGPAREAVGYAYTELISPREQDVELRCGADDNCTVWLNGEKVFSRQQWLNGTRLDRFITPVRLQAGKNRLLVKVCQGEQHKNPQVPNNWSLQLRFSNFQGRGIALKSVGPTAQNSTAGSTDQ